MLVYEQDGNILPLLREPVEGLLDSSRLGLVVHNQEVLLRFWSGRDVLKFVVSAFMAHARPGRLTPIPASSSPVTESCAGISVNLRLAFCLPRLRSQRETAYPCRRLLVPPCLRWFGRTAKAT